MDIRQLVNNFTLRTIGGAEEATEPVLKPYSASTDQLLLSKEMFDIIDLISEGPIHGLVDGNGASVRGNRNLCGIYLDDTPVRVTRKQDPKYWTNEVVWDIQDTGANTISANDPDSVVYELANYDSKINALTEDEDLTEEDYNQISITYRNNEKLKGFFRSLKEKSIRSRDPFQLYQTEDIKFAFISHDQIGFSNLPNVNPNSVDYAVYYSGANGTGELGKRYAKRGNPNSSYFEQSTAVEIPEPILNLPTKVGTSQQNYASVNGGYIILPLASGDGLVIDGGKVKFSVVDGNCLDPISEGLDGAFLFLKATTEDLTNSFNFEQFDLSMNLGYESQSVLPLFEETVRSYDTPIRLYGPINPESFVDRTNPASRNKMTPSIISAAYEPNRYSFDALTPTNISAFYGKATNITQTLASSYNYADWAKNSLLGAIGSDESIFTHNIDNEAVIGASLIITINGLNDTAIDGDSAGQPVATSAALRVEIGIEGDSDRDDPLWETLIGYKSVYDVGFEGLIVGSAFRFTLGSPSSQGDNWMAVTEYTKNGVTTTTEGGPRAIGLPPPVGGRARYIRVYRLTPETFSSKKVIDMSLNGINEHYAYSFSYPLSAVAGVTIDARSFSRIPTRTYDVRLKKVMIPSNYYPLDSQGMDRRKIKHASSYNNNIKLYNGDWDGTFIRAWTDNPAWILYDLLVDPIYGVGNNIDDLKDIDIWTLYQIGRYCDGVNENGYYVGVPDGYGGLEPRFVCNVVLQNERDALDIINSIASIFRGIAFYGGGSMNFSYDHLEEKIAIFSNSNVEGGSFQYSDTLKSSRFTVVEVPYMDERNGYLQKIESAEDERAIQKYGYIKKTFEGFGITTRGQAQRLARYALFSNNLETEMISFTASREGFFVQPSDIIKIDDELKNIDVANGYINHVDYTNKSVTTNWIPTGGLGTGVLFYTATGRWSIQNLFDQAYNQDLDVSIADINKLKNTQIQLFEVSSYEQVSTSVGNTVVGSGLKINLNTGQSNINNFDEVKIGSMFSASLTGRTENLYKIIGVSYNENDTVAISAIEHEPRKFALIESGIRFEKDDSFWSDRQLDMMINHPLPPLGSELFTGISDGGINFTGTITGNTTGVVASSFLCRLISPAGTFYEETITNDASPKSVYFNGMAELGTYTLYTRSVGPAPNKLKSTAVTTSINVTEESTYIYLEVGITGFNLMNGIGQYDLAQQTGSFDSFGKNLQLGWQLRDRLGATLSSAAAFRTRGNIKVSVDILDKNGNEVTLGVLQDAQENGLTISSNTIEGWFGGTYPRDFQVVLNTTGNGANDNSGILTILNNPPTIQNLGIIDYYDGVGNNIEINIKGDINAIKDSDGFSLFTGDTTGFQGIGTDNTLLSRAFANNIIPKQKRVTTFKKEEYPTFINGTFIADRSLRDIFFINGEQVTVESNGSYPSNIAGDTLYDLIRGDSIGTYFSMDVENIQGTGTGIQINCRTYNSEIVDAWRPLNYAGNNWSTHTTTGSLSQNDTNANAPQLIKTGIYNRRTRRGGGLFFNGSGAIRLAGDYLTSEILTCTTQSGRNNITPSLQFYPITGYEGYLSTEIRTLLDTSSESGGFYLAMITGVTDAERMLSGDIKLAGDPAGSSVTILDDDCSADNTSNYTKGDAGESLTLVFSTDHYVATPAAFASSFMHTTTAWEDAKTYTYSVDVKSTASNPATNIIRSDGITTYAVKTLSAPTSSWVTQTGSFTVDLTTDPTVDQIGFYVTTASFGNIEYKNILIQEAGGGVGTTGDTITLVSQTGYNWNEWNHVALSLNTFSGDYGGSEVWHSGAASLVVNGKIGATALGSGSGMRFTYGPQAIGAAAGIIITGNGGRTASSMDRTYMGYMNAVNLYGASGDLDEIQAMRYGTYNQYIFKLANTGTIFPIISMTDNVSDQLSIVANSGQILQFNVGNYNNAVDETLLDKINNNGGYNGVQKLFYVAFDTATNQLEKDILGLYSLREEDFIAGHIEGDKTLIWQNFEGKDLAIQYISGADDAESAQSGRWIIWSGDISKPYDVAGTDKIFYNISGGQYLFSSAPSGHPPITTTWSTGEDAEAYSLTGTRTPATTRRAGPLQTAAFKDLYLRVSLSDDIGAGNIFPPLSDPAMVISYAGVQNESKNLLGYQAKILGDQSRTLTDFIYAAYDFQTAGDFTDFDSFLSSYLGQQSTESPIPPETPAERVATPIISPANSNIWPDFNINPLQFYFTTPSSRIWYKKWTSLQTEPSTWTDGGTTSPLNLSNVPVPYNGSLEVRAYASKDGLTNSTITSRYYTNERDI